MDALIYPEILKTISGIEVDTVRDWENFRRSEILSLFEENVYGKIPQISMDSFEVLSFTKNGESFKKVVRIFAGDFHFDVSIIYPEDYNEDKHYPAALYMMLLGQKEENVPVPTILSSGFAAVLFQVTDIAKDEADSHETGIFKSFKGINCGTISAWSWGASRVMDYLYQDKNIKADSVMLVGHSRGGKTALWAFANDERFALCAGNNSGCAGASLSRGTTGEKIENITGAFGYWFSKNLKKYSGREEMLPIDQHMLLALAAPRPIYITSASKDAWSCPGNEVDSCKMASEVYELYGARGLVLEEPIVLDKPYMDGDIAYHKRNGEHDITEFDWKCFLKFAKSTLSSR